MMLLRQATFATSECHPAMPGNVSNQFDIRSEGKANVIIKIVHAMQSEWDDAFSDIAVLTLSTLSDYAITHNLTPFISMQNHYSLVYREEEREMMPTLKHFGVGSIPWSPLARGFLCRPLGEQTKRGDTDK